jgi:peptidoglycan/LPS O-acetylase OafA/YrhL
VTGKLRRALSTAAETAARELWRPPSGQLRALDGLRAAAVLLVVCSHYTTEFWPDVIRTPVPSYGQLPMFRWGWTGVDLFFVLSGLLIGRQLWRERERTGTVDFWGFFLRRGFRIWPLYFAMMALFAVTGAVQPNRWDLTFLSNYLPGGYNRGWSLATEEQFYILTPLLLIATPWVRRIEGYAWVLAGTIPLRIIVRELKIRELEAAGLGGPRMADLFHYQFHLHHGALVAGLAIALAMVVRPKLFERPADAGFSRTGFGAFAFASLLGFALRMVDHHVFAFTALWLIFGSLVFWLLLDRGIAARIAGWRGFYPVSRLSFGMYLNHFLVFPGVTAAVIAALRQAGVPEGGQFFGGLLAGVAVSMAVATVTFFLIEHPFLVLRDRVLGKHPAAAPATAAPAPAAPAPAIDVPTAGGVGVPPDAFVPSVAGRTPAGRPHSRV